MRSYWKHTPLAFWLCLSLEGADKNNEVRAVRSSPTQRDTNTSKTVKALNASVGYCLSRFLFVNCWLPRSKNHRPITPEHSNAILQRTDTTGSLICQILPSNSSTKRLARSNHAEHSRSLDSIIYNCLSAPRLQT